MFSLCQKLRELTSCGKVFTMRVSIIFLSLCAIFLGIVVYGCIGVQDLKWHITDIAEHAQMIELGETFRADVARMRYCEKNLFFVLKEPERVTAYKDEWENILQAINKTTARLYELEKADTNYLCLLNEMQLPPDYITTFRRTVDQITNKEIIDPVKANQGLKAFPHLAKTLNEKALKFVTNERQELKESIKLGKRHFEIFQYYLVMAVGIGFILTISLTILLVRVIQKESTQHISSKSLSE